MSSQISRKKLWWHECTAAEILERVKECDIAFLPMGSIEQHGYHLPTGEDTYHAMGIGEKLAEKTGVMLLPPPWYGLHPYWQFDQAATIPLKFETWLSLFGDIVPELLRPVITSSSFSTVMAPSGEFLFLRRSWAKMAISY